MKKIGANNNESKNVEKKKEQKKMEDMETKKQEKGKRGRGPFTKLLTPVQAKEGEEEGNGEKEMGLEDIWPIRQ